jgi:hypothetical protein
MSKFFETPKTGRRGGSRNFKIKIKERKRNLGKKEPGVEESVGICTISNFWNNWNRQGGRLIIAVYGLQGRVNGVGNSMVRIIYLSLSLSYFPPSSIVYQFFHPSSAFQRLL